MTAAAQAACAVVFAGGIAVTGHRERGVGRLVIRLCVTAAVDVPHSFQLAGEPLRSDWRRIVMHDCLPERYALFRRNIARTLDAVSTARYERTLAPSSSLENSCANRLRTSASGAPVRSHNELIARSCLIASLPVSKSELIKTPTVKLTRVLRLSPAAGRRPDTLTTLVHQTTHLDALVWLSVAYTAVRVEHPL